MAVPMYLLYEIGILFAQWMQRSKAAEQNAASPGT
jgi:Sec-independent protein secretion pathway component TatC